MVGMRNAKCGMRNGGAFGSEPLRGGGARVLRGDYLGGCFFVSRRICLVALAHSGDAIAGFLRGGYEGG